VTDLYAYLFARIFSPDPPPKIPLYLAPKVAERFHPLLTDDSADMRLAEGFELTVVEPGEELRVGPFRVATAPMRHTVPTIGVRVEADGASLAYSADTGPSDDLVALAGGCDLLVAEASWHDDGQHRPPIHMTAREAGEAATKAGANRLMLTHIRPYMDRNRSRAEAAEAFDGEVALAEEGMVREVGS
jgi:ribonuclease BN (tRNA processing enzyme)